ncbi:MAG: phage shock protein PspA [Deltaproteobacteria bacterium]|nr:MAG: phage shock protein PspA [Deltaproteobacteria bacterium]
MGVFSRLKDIINSNINSMVDKAEDPEKLLKLMMLEMEDTLVEIKASAAGVMAQRKRVERRLESCRCRADDWEQKARLAMSKQREELAREALLEKHKLLRQAQALERELVDFDDLVRQYQEDIGKLEAKLAEAREKHRVLAQRHAYASGARRVHEQIRKAESTGAFARFDRLERRVERAEAEIEVARWSERPGLEEKFAKLQEEELVDAELKRLRRETAGDND